MKVIFDPETDTLSIIFRDDKISESDEIREGIRYRPRLCVKSLAIKLLRAYPPK